MSKPAMMRLDRLLANMGYGSRKDIQQLARLGAVTLDGVDIKKPDVKVAVSPDLSTRLMIDGEPLDPVPGMALMLNKPLGVTCSHKDAGPLVYDLLPTRWRGRNPAISTIGRLDKETSGLLLMTDDGDLLHRVIAPRHHVAKRYRVTLERPLNGNEREIFAAGTLLLEGEEKPLQPAILEVLGDKEAFLSVTEGRYHQVRRMFASVGNHVTGLHRDRIGGLDLPEDLAPGDYRLLDELALAAIFAPS